VSSPASVTKNNSRPSRRQRISMAPPFETCRLPPGPGYGSTYTSGRPDSLDSYATHFPSGDSTAKTSLKSACRNGCGCPAPLPSSGSTKMSPLVFPLAACISNDLPSGKKLVGTHPRPSEGISRAGSEPLEGLRINVFFVPFTDRQIMLDPSG